jgi:hypothetical protein
VSFFLLRLRCFDDDDQCKLTLYVCVLQVHYILTAATDWNKDTPDTRQMMKKAKTYKQRADEIDSDPEGGDLPYAISINEGMYVCIHNVYIFLLTNV